MLCHEMPARLHGFPPTSLHPPTDPRGQGKVPVLQKSHKKQFIVYRTTVYIKDVTIPETHNKIIPR